MSQSNIILKLKNDAEAIDAFPNKKKEFFIDLLNASPNYLPQAKVRIEGPPQIRFLVKSQWYGGIPSGKSKRRLFSIISKEEGIFQITASLSSKTNPIVNIPIKVRVGNAAIMQNVSKSEIKVTSTKITTKVNCPFCNELIDSDASFCPQCGSNVVEKLAEQKESAKSTKFCVKCGTELPSDAKFCAKCGTKLT